MSKEVKESTYTHRSSHTVEVIKSFEIGTNDDGRVDVTLKETLDCGEDFTGEDDDGRGTITNFFILGSGELDHGFGSWVSNINLE